MSLLFEKKKFWFKNFVIHQPFVSMLILLSNGNILVMFHKNCTSEAQQYFQFYKNNKLNSQNSLYLCMLKLEEDENFKKS